jgi:hypothetical protein
LFFFQIFSPYEENENNSSIYESRNTSLNPKYRNARQLCNGMTQNIPSNRPKFEEIFNSKRLWALDKNELKIDNQMKSIIEENCKDKQSIYHIIYTKLNNN